MSAMTSLIGAAAGAGLMYVLDPERGVRRRAMARDQLDHTRRKMGEAAEGVLNDARNRGQGMLAKLRGGLEAASVADDVLEERIRAAMGGLLRYPRLVQVLSENGRITITGVVASDEVARFVRRIRRMHGVARVDNLLDVRPSPADLPGAREPIPPRPPGPPMTDLFRSSWPPSVRAGATALGVSLVLGALRRAGMGTVLVGATGVVLLIRAFTNEPLFRGRRGRERSDAREA